MSCAFIPHLNLVQLGEIKQKQGDKTKPQVGPIIYPWSLAKESFPSPRARLKVTSPQNRTGIIPRLSEPALVLFDRSWSYFPLVEVKAVVASLWPVADRSTKSLMQEFYKLREAKDGLPKIEALREAQLELLNGKIGSEDERLVTNRQIAHEEGKPETAKQPRFTADPKRPFAHPYYWAPFILIGNWQ